MKMLRNSIVFITAMMAIGCAKELAPQVNDGGTQKTFTASFEDTAVKVLLKPGAEVSKVEWEIDDQVSVFDGTNNVLYKANTAGESTELTSDGTLASAETYYAAYPYNEDAKLADGVITTALPFKQTAVLGSFSTHLAVAQATESSFSFKNVGALIKVTVAVDGITEIIFKGNNEECVAGNIKVTVAEEPTWSAGSGFSRYARLVAGTDKTLAQGDYYISVLPQTFSKGFSISAVRQDGTFATNYVTDPVTLERCDGIAGAFDTNDTFGGSEDNPYILSTPTELRSMYYLAVHTKKVYFQLGADINMESVTDWIPVNLYPYVKQIDFDGKGYTISNFSSPANTYSSMFGVLYGSCKNVKFVDAEITSNSANQCGVLGGFIGTTGKPATVENVTIEGATITGKLTNNEDYGGVGGLGGTVCGSTITNCHISGLTITNTGRKTGGIAGATTTTTSFSGCSVSGNISGTGNYIGGIIGYTNDETSVTSCSATCEVSGTNYIGGIIGYCTGNTTISYCSLNGKVTGTNRTGGIVGDAIDFCNISKSSAAGSITGTNFSGGIIGNNESALKVSDCYTTCTITSSSQMAGGILGRAAYYYGPDGKANTTGDNVRGDVTIERCYSSGNITAKYGAAGIVGVGHTSDVSVSDCIAWNNTITASSAASTNYYSGAIIGGSATSASLKFEDCYRSSALQISSAVEANKKLSEDGNQTELTAGAAAKPYHGRAAAADATLSSVATTLGWSADVWDLTGDVPSLKAPVTE